MQRLRLSARLKSSFAAIALVVSASGATAQAGSFLSKNNDPIPEAASMKGLQVQITADAIALGVKRATLNIDIARMIDPAGAPDSVPWEMDGRTFHFRRDAVEAHDREIKPLSDAGIQVALIILNYRSKDPAVSAIMRPSASRAISASPIDAFNVGDAEGAAWFRALMEFIADRYSANDASHGRVTGYIIGNEVDSHFAWYDMGDVGVEALVENYERAVRLAHAAVRKASTHARVYLSLDRQWMTAAFVEPLRSAPSRIVLDAFARRARAGGDYDWSLAFHPYPENIRDPRAWLDRSVRDDAETAMITPRNLEVLPAYMKRPEMLFNGKQRRIILSEQGFNTPDCPEGEAWQAAGFCYTWVKLQRLEGIDAYILHRHVDHPHEGGLQLGLWKNVPGTTKPDRKKLIYEVFRACDTPEREAAFAPYLEVVGVKKWSDVR